ncbi:MAG: PilZ domain-containing protein [Myxococcales bacterium]|nr:MAG: PilZ domain-containing protein [Myxococcales bacterium]
MSKRAPSDAIDRRKHERFLASISVDYTHGDTFLFSYIHDISEMGIFIRSDDPLEIGSELTLRFNDEQGEPLEIEGEVVWINHVREAAHDGTPGMGVQFKNLGAADRERVFNLVKTIAYLREEHYEQNN